MYPPPPRPTLFPYTTLFRSYYEWWFDRIDRALSAGTPLAIEQDLLWAKNPRKGEMTSLVSHGALPTGTEPGMRSEEHTSELQSHSDLVCRLLLEKKKNMIKREIYGRSARSPPCRTTAPCITGGVVAGASCVAVIFHLVYMPDVASCNFFRTAYRV